MPPRLAVLLPARNEAASLPATLDNLRAATPPPDCILVLADHCTDATAEIAEQAGAIVFRRDEGEAENKGLALRWLFEQWPPALAECAAVIIMDADSRVAPNFFAEARQAVLNGARVAQCFVQPVDLPDSSAVLLGAYSDLLTQAVETRLHQWRGWPVRLRGMGMLFEPRLLHSLLPSVHTRSAEDIELGLLAVARGETIHFLPDAILYDPKPPTTRQATRQRARWLAGTLQIWRDYWPLVLRLAWRGPRHWNWLALMLLRPATLFLALKAVGFLLTLALPVAVWLRVALGLWVAADIFFYVGGLWLIPAAQRAMYARALWRAPAYLWVWFSGVWLAWRARGQSRWLSVRHDN